jgi:hypothetical protein
MRRLLLLFACLILLIQFAAAEIIINKQPDEIYSLGDIIPIPATVKPVTDISGIFQMNLFCNGHETNFYKNGVSLAAGEEKQLEPSLVLMRNVIGELKGTCKIKAILGDDFVLTEEFKISDFIEIHLGFEQVEFNPGENVLLEGDAVKENGKDVNGFIEMEIRDGNNSILTHLETINNGFFSMNITFPGDIKAGAYLMKLNAHEKDLVGETTNKGFSDMNILIKQVPTSLEVLFEDSAVEPGENMNVKAILHDQTGEKIASTSFITIKDNKGKIHEQLEMATDEFLEFPIPYNQAPADWVVVAVSNKLTSEAKFTILEKEDVKVEIINKTVEITNMGNVVYNKTVLVKIGNKSLNIDVLLDVDKSQKYILSAPDGEYEVEVIADEESVSEEVILTGKSVDIRKASSKVGSLVRFPIVWIFIIAILGFIAFIVFKKGYKKSFVGYIGSKIPKKNKGEKALPLKKDSLVQTGSKAELSLSIKGDKQNISMVALKIKNLQKLQSKEGSAEETIQKIINATEESKAAVYENHNELFFILCPTRTRTFKNERTALNLAKKIKEILEDHNKKFKQTIEFGISLNYGTIIAKQEKDVLKFMSMGTLMGTAKKVSALAENEIFLGEKMNEKMRSEVKTIRHQKGNIHVYSIKEIKDVEGNKKFIRSFMDRIEKK